VVGGAGLRLALLAFAPVEVQEEVPEMEAQPRRAGYAVRTAQSISRQLPGG